MANPHPATPGTVGGIDHRTLPRRRGEVLVEAIHAATLAELAETGYANLSVERVAARARTSKAAIYRRWPARADLVADAIRRSVGTEAAEIPDTGDIRGDLFAMLRSAADRLAGSYGEAVRGLITETLADPQATADMRTRLTGARTQLITMVLERAVTRGQAGPHALSERLVSLAPTLLSHHYLQHGAPIEDAVITGILDEVVLPLIQPR
jgi:AcrR family transcriptional regulator